MQRGEVRNPVMVLVLYIFTCGVYAIIWTYQVMLDLNKGLGREEFNPVKELVLTFLTCGLWGLYLNWRICNAAIEVQRSWGVQPQFEPAILFVLFFVYVGPFFLQEGLNKAWEQGAPGGAGHGSAPSGF